MTGFSADAAHAVLPDLPCRDLVELVTDHLDGTLDPAIERRLQAHLATCDSCVDYIEQIRTTAGLAASLNDSELPPRLRAGLLDAFRARQR